MDAVTYEKKLQQAISLSQQATDKDKEGSFQQAFELYKVALDQWNVLCRCQTNAVLREKLYRKMEEYIARAETLKRFLQKQSEKQLLLLRHPSPPNHLLFSHPSSSSSSCSASLPGTHLVLLSPGSPPILTQQQQTLLTSVEGLSSNSSSIQNALSQSSLGGLGGGVGTAGSGGEGYGSSGSMRASGDGDMSEEERMREKLNSAIVTEKPEVRWTDIAGLEAAKDALQEAIVLPSRFPSLFTGERTPWKGILLYGPPGTGKTFLAKAVAAEAEATFLSVSSADLVSKWQGESEKLVRSLFAMARDRRPSIIFIDEVDSMCGARSEADSDSSRRIKTEFLVQMQGLPKDAGDVLVLGATNVPWALDSAIRRRFERRVYIPLPDLKARRRLVALCVGNTPHQLTPADFHTLALQTEGFSGADISVVVRDALFEPLRRCRTATHFKRVLHKGRFWMSPCSPSDPDVTKQEMSLMEVPPDHLLPPDLTMGDFTAVLRNARPSVSKEDIRKHEEWTRQYGVEGH